MADTANNNQSSDGKPADSIFTQAGDWIEENGTANVITAGVGAVGIAAVFNMVKGWFVDEDQQGFFGGLLSKAASLAVLVGGAYALLKGKAGDKIMNQFDGDPDNNVTVEGVTDAISNKIKALTDTDFEKTFDDLLKGIGELSDEAKASLVETLDKMDGKEDGDVDLKAIPATQFNAAKEAIENAYSR